MQFNIKTAYPDWYLEFPNPTNFYFGICWIYVKQEKKQAAIRM